MISILWKNMVHCDFLHVFSVQSGKMWYDNAIKQQLLNLYEEYQYASI